jgi:D-glycero-D-manno-heptose 1,7-bisphosphate phosphatase
MTGQAVILVGGAGTRLGPLTQIRPKPLMDVAGVPFLDHLLLRCQANAVSRVLLLAGYLADQIQGYAGERARRFPGLDLTVCVEPTPLGTGGALRQAGDLLDEGFFLMNGDSVFDIAWQGVQRAAASGALGALALRPTTDIGRYGAVDVADGLVTGFHAAHEGRGERLMNAGLYWVRREILAWLGEGAVSLERDVFPTLAARRRLAAHVAQGDFIDIGVPDDLAAAQAVLPAWTARVRAGAARS